MFHPTNTSKEKMIMMRASKIMRTVHLECLRNHAVHLGQHVLDGCSQFCPQNLLPDQCAACGCHRGFHRPYPIFDILKEDREDDKENHMSTTTITIATATATATQNTATAVAKGFKLMGKRVLMSSELTRERFPSPPPGFQEAEAEAAPRKRLLFKRKTRFTVKQKAAMHWLAGRLKWCMKNEQEKGQIKSVCDKIGITRTMFRNWVYNKKRPVRKPSNVIVLSP